MVQGSVCARSQDTNITASQKSWRQASLLKITLGTGCTRCQKRLLLSSLCADVPIDKYAVWVMEDDDDEIPVSCVIRALYSYFPLPVLDLCWACNSQVCVCVHVYIS